MRFAIRLLLLLVALAAAALPARPSASGEPSAPPPAPATAATPTPESPPPGAPPAAPSMPPSPFWVSTEVRFPNYFSSLFYAFYAEDPMELRLLVHNVSDKDAELPGGFDLCGGLRVTGRDGAPMKESLPPAACKEPEPAKLAQGQILGVLFDLPKAFPEIRKPGEYSIHWELDTLKSNAVGVRVIQRFNPDAEYEAVLSTGEGEIAIRFHGKEAPLHVRNFVNLARLGYYDGMPFHTVARERSIRTGAPGPDGSGSIGYALPAEISSRKHVAGTVSMYRDQRLPGSDSDGSQFFICLAETPNRDGRFTIFGEVTKGLEVAKKISARETITDPSRPSGTPQNPVKLDKVNVTETPRSTASKE